MKAQKGIAGKNILIAIVITVAIVIGLLALLTTDRTAQKGSGLGEEYTYDLTRFKDVDPALILYEESAPFFKTGLSKSTGVAVGPEDKIYIAGDQQILVLDSAANKISTITLSDQPQCLTVVPDGTIYVGMIDHVVLYDNEGKQSSSWEPAGERTIFTSIAVRGNNVFAADAGNRMVLRYDKTGKLLNRIGKKDLDNNIPGFTVPSPNFDIALTDDGLLRVVNPGAHLIEAYTYDGHREFWWGEYNFEIQGFSGCCNPTDFALLNNGAGFVTAEKGITRVKIFDADGQFIGVVAGPESFVEHDRIVEFQGGGSLGGLDVAVDSQGRVLVLDPLTNQLRIFT
ncbi:MAG: hypothetical protein GY869_05845, partial [Planctomycetes bacterium]|nr:hypothetical protein [Planctomycetota bacterium]